jgi:hypothetical protein
MRGPWPKRGGTVDRVWFCRDRFRPRLSDVPRPNGRSDCLPVTKPFRKEWRRVDIEKLGLDGRSRRRADIANRRWTSRVLPSKWSRNGKIPPEAALRQSREQRLRLGDHRHLRRRRKAFERGPEHGVRFESHPPPIIKVLCGFPSRPTVRPPHQSPIARPSEPKFLPIMGRKSSSSEAKPLDHCGAFESSTLRPSTIANVSGTAVRDRDPLT